MNVVTLSLLPFFTVSKLEKSHMRQPPPYFLPLPNSPLKNDENSSQEGWLVCAEEGQGGQGHAERASRPTGQS